MIRILIVAALLTAPAACGRKGDPLPPSEASTVLGAQVQPTD